MKYFILDEVQGIIPHNPKNALISFRYKRPPFFSASVVPRPQRLRLLRGLALVPRTSDPTKPDTRAAVGRCLRIEASGTCAVPRPRKRFKDGAVCACCILNKNSKAAGLRARSGRAGRSLHVSEDRQLALPVHGQEGYRLLQPRQVLQRRRSLFRGLEYRFLDAETLGPSHKITGAGRAAARDYCAEKPTFSCRWSKER